MKKILTLLVIMAMLISTMSMMVLTPSAVDIEGDWTTYREANDYNHPVDEVTGQESGYRPAPGYKYTDEGFSTIPADYTGSYPYINVVTKEKHNIKEGIYIKYRIDEFSYNGEDGKADSWIAVALWNQPNFTIHSSAFGEGYFQHFRGAGDGKASIAGQEFKPEMDAQGREIYTFEATWDGTAYHFLFCGVEIADGQKKSQALENIDSTGEFYVGLALRSTEAGGKASLTILEYGTSEKDATKPIGSDTKEPEVNNNVAAPIADPSTIPANMPSVYWDASLYPNASASGMDMSALGNNGYRCKFTITGPVMFPWYVRKDVSYDMKDFPVLAIMVKNYWNTTTCWYMPGDIYDATNGYLKSISAYDGEYYEDDEFKDYTLLLLDLTDYENATGRINGVRLDIQGAKPEADEFDICYMGWFRSVEEAKIYGANYLGVDGNTEGSQTEETQAAADDTTALEDTDIAEETIADEGTTDASTATTPAGTTDASTATTPAGGCASVVGSGLTGLFALAALVVLKKKTKSYIL